MNPASGKCLDATGQSSANGTRLQTWSCAGTTDQRWHQPT
ncbi:RICIN domain-containing protein [Streptomyces sp. NPDC001848]